MRIMTELQVERYCDNGEYSHYEIIDTDNGAFVCFICPECGGRWTKDKEYEFCEHSCN